MSKSTHGARPLLDDWARLESNEPLQSLEELLVEGKLASDGAKELAYAEIEAKWSLSGA